MYSGTINSEEALVNEIIQQLKSRVGLNDTQAQSAAQTVIDYLQQRLPGPVASELDKVVSGAGGAQGTESKLEGFLGKKSA